MNTLFSLYFECPPPTGSYMSAAAYGKFVILDNNLFLFVGLFVLIEIWPTLLFEWPDIAHEISG